MKELYLGGLYFEIILAAVWRAESPLRKWLQSTREGLMAWSRVMGNEGSQQIQDICWKHSH